MLKQLTLGLYIKTTKVTWIIYKFHVIKSMRFGILRTASTIIFAHTFCALEILEFPMGTGLPIKRYFCAA